MRPSGIKIIHKFKEDLDVDLVAYIVSCIVFNFTKNGGDYFLSTKTLAQHLGRSDDSIRDAIKKAIEKDLIDDDEFDGRKMLKTTALFKSYYISDGRILRNNKRKITERLEKLPDEQPENPGHNININSNNIKNDKKNNKLNNKQTEKNSLINFSISNVKSFFYDFITEYLSDKEIFDLGSANKIIKAIEDKIISFDEDEKKHTAKLLTSEDQKFIRAFQKELQKELGLYSYFTESGEEIDDFDTFCSSAALHIAKLLLDLPIKVIRTNQSPKVDEVNEVEEDEDE